jgi:site-specific DNA-methyltransferase (adenine-specific)
VPTWNPSEILELSDRRSIYFDPRTESKKDGMPAGMRVPMDVWYGQYWGRVQGNNTERRGYHDNQLPEVYLERVIRATSNEGDLVIDPFLGSGTTGVIAHALKRRFIGTEFSEDNAKSAFERMKAGPVRLGAATGQSTAIFQGRKGGEKKRAQLESAPAQPLHKVTRKAATGERVRNGKRIREP